MKLLPIVALSVLCTMPYAETLDMDSQNQDTVIFYTNGGKIEGDVIDLYEEGVGADLPITVYRDSSFFTGWYENEELSGTPKFEIDASAKGAKTFYAGWYKLKMPAIDAADSCFAISDVAELYGFAAYVNGAHGMHSGRASNVCAKLTKDIVVNENVIKDGKLNTADTAKFLVWESIEHFSGTIDGQGHTISGIYCGGLYARKLGSNYYNKYDSEYGFIRRASGYGDSTGYVVIKNLRIEASYIESGYYVGGFVGKVLSPKTVYPAYDPEYVVPGAELVIENSSFDGVLKTKGNGPIGGLVGSATTKLTVRNSSVSGSIMGYGIVGGLVGDGANLAIYDSHNAAGLEGKRVGGLVGQLSTGISVIDNCSNTGDIYAADFTKEDSEYTYGTAGGLIGTMTSDESWEEDYVTSHLTLTRSFNTGNVSSGERVAGLIGYSWQNLLIANNYNLGKVTAYGKKNVEPPVGLVYVGSCGPYLDSIYIENNYNMGALVFESGKPGVEPSVRQICEGGKIKAENNYYLQNASEPYTSQFGLPATADEFKDSTVAKALHAYVRKADDILKEKVTGEVWTQGKDYPILAVPKSNSSSVASSSSDAKSSSSEATSSSSECKDDTCKESLPEWATVPTFHVSVIGRELQVAGAHIGASFALLDMQGRVLRTGMIGESNFSVMVPRSGGYLVRIGNDVRRVFVR